jgi:hypothetical protein
LRIITQKKVLKSRIDYKKDQKNLIKTDLERVETIKFN